MLLFLQSEKIRGDIMNNILGERIRTLRERAGMKQTDLSKYLNISNSTLSQYETGQRVPSDEIKIKIANRFDVTVGYLLGTESSVRPLSAPLTSGTTISVLGEVPAGIPIEAVENIIDEIELSEKMSNDGFEYFALLVSGDSMYPEYMDGDIVIVRRQPNAETGDDVIAYVNGYNATLKRLIKSERGITLRAVNPAYETKTYSNEEIQTLPISIAGVVVEQRRNR